MAFRIFMTCSESIVDRPGGVGEDARGSGVGTGTASLSGRRLFGRRPAERISSIVSPNGQMAAGLVTLFRDPQDDYSRKVGIDIRKH
jgi:hypothetical protein